MLTEQEYVQRVLELQRVEVTSFVRGCPRLYSREDRGRRLLLDRTTHGSGQIQPAGRRAGNGESPIHVRYAVWCEGLDDLGERPRHDKQPTRCSP